jgi:hypothetical protein
MTCLTTMDLKRQLNITSDIDDPILVDKLAAAKAWVSSYIGSDPDAVDADGNGTAPAPIGEAILQLAAHLYENREATLVGVTAQQLPFGFLDLLSPYRAFAW